MQKVITDFSTGKKSTFAEPDRRGHHPEKGTAEANRTRHKGDIKDGTGGRFLELTPIFLCPLYFQNIWQTGKTPGILRGNTDRNSPPSISTHPGVKRCRVLRKLQGGERLTTETDTPPFRTDTPVRIQEQGSGKYQGQPERKLQTRANRKQSSRGRGGKASF